MVQLQSQLHGIEVPYRLGLCSQRLLFRAVRRYCAIHIYTMNSSIPRSILSEPTSRMLYYPIPLFSYPLSNKQSSSTNGLPSFRAHEASSVETNQFLAVHRHGGPPVIQRPDFNDLRFPQGGVSTPQSIESRRPVYD